MLNLNRLELLEAGPTDNLGRSITHRPDSAPPPRWARRSAWLAVLTTVPSGLWRMAMAVGIPVGVSDQIRHEHYGFPGGGRRTCSGSHSCWSAWPCSPWAWSNAGEKSFTTGSPSSAPGASASTATDSS